MANQPEKGFRCGARVTLKKVAIQKRYMTADGEWKSTNSYEAHDLQKLKLVVGEAYRYLGAMELGIWLKMSRGRG